MPTRPLDVTFRAPAVALRRPHLRAPSRRAVVIAAAAVAATSLAYAGARETSLFAVTAISVEGSSGGAVESVRRELAPLAGESLVAVDAEETARALEALPTIESASVDRAFPHTLAVVVVEERPLAVVEAGERSLLVSERGTVIRSVTASARPRTPRVKAPETIALGPGEAVSDEDLRRALAALAALPRRFPARIAEARSGEAGIVVVAEDGMEIRLGDDGDLAVKLASAAAVLRSLSAEDRGGLGYLDVTLPNRVVGSANPQLESEG